MKTSRSAVDELLHELKRELRTHGWRARRRALAEVRDHLLCSIEEASDAVGSREAQEELAVRRLGDVHEVAAQLRDARPRRRWARGPIVAGTLAAVATFALPASQIAEELAPKAAVAATPAPIAEKPCASAWNSESNTSWQAYAKRLGSTRALVEVAGITVQIDPKSGKIKVVNRTHSACVIKLWLAREPGHFQNAVIIVGARRSGRIRFGVKIGPKTPNTPRRVRQRTTLQFANSTVSANGTIDFVGVSIP